MSNQEKPVRVRKAPAAAGAAVKKTATRKKSVTASLAEVRFAPAKKAAAKKAAPRKAAKKSSRVVKEALASALPRKLLKPDRGTAGRKASNADNDAYELLRSTVVTALEGLKAKDVVTIDVRAKTSMTDLIVVASGTSTRHVKSLANEVVKESKKIGQAPLGVEGDRDAEWVLVDLGDAIIHVMLPRSREFYGLERLWTVGDPDPADAFDDEAAIGS